MVEVKVVVNPGIKSKVARDCNRGCSGKFEQNCEIWLKLSNLADIAKFGQNGKF